MGTGNSKSKKRKVSSLDVGDYSFRHLIGHGSFAEVRMAVHKPTVTEVAVKIINKSKLKPLDQKRVQIEREVHSQLTHPHIVRLIEVIETETHVYMFLELAKCNLASYFNRVGKIEEAKCKVPFYQLVSAIDYAHSKGFVHRDIKLENIYMTNHGIVIGDWGLSCPWNKSICRKSSVGTPAYCSPEIVNGVDYCGPEVDVWSLGVVLYRLISGRLPFDGVNMQDDLLAGRFEVPPGCSSQLQDLLKSMMDPIPGKRATISEVLSSAWLEGVEEEASAAMPTVSSSGNLQPQTDSSEDEGGDDDDDDEDEDETDGRRRSTSQSRTSAGQLKKSTLAVSASKSTSKPTSKTTSTSAVKKIIVPRESVDSPPALSPAGTPGRTLSPRSMSPAPASAKTPGRGNTPLPPPISPPIPLSSTSSRSSIPSSGSATRPSPPSRDSKERGRRAAKKEDEDEEEEAESGEERLVTRSTPAAHLVVASN